MTVIERIMIDFNITLEDLSITTGIPTFQLEKIFVANTPFEEKEKVLKKLAHKMEFDLINVDIFKILCDPEFKGQHTKLFIESAKNRLKNLSRIPIFSTDLFLYQSIFPYLNNEELIRFRYYFSESFLSFYLDKRASAQFFEEELCLPEGICSKSLKETDISLLDDLVFKYWQKYPERVSLKKRKISTIYFILNQNEILQSSLYANGIKEISSICRGESWHTEDNKKLSDIIKIPEKMIACDISEIKDFKEFSKQLERFGHKIKQYLGE